MGVWWSGSWRAEDGAPDTAAELEALGYTALWSSGGFGPGLSPHFARLMAATARIAVVSGIVSIWTTPPDELAADVADLEANHPGRFVLGLGTSHSAIVQNYRRPYSHMVGYLDGLDAATPAAPSGRRVLAALGPRMLTLAAERAAGAHSYFVPVEHTARARELLGPEALLAVEVTAVPDGDAGRARDVARSFTTGYLGLPNYAANLRHLGYDDADLAGGGSDRLVDDVVAWGGPERIARQISRHLEAGADHVCLQVLAPRESFPMHDYRTLAPAVLDA